MPGHAHADTLSFELSIDDQRVFVNSGTSCYGISNERLRQRQTKAHNTVEIDGKSSSEVWSGFRVAKRAYPSPVKIKTNNKIYIECSHDGFNRLKGKVVHTRTWEMSKNAVRILDILKGNFDTAKVFYHIHPDIEVEVNGNIVYLKAKNGRLYTIEVNGGFPEVYKSTWHPEFGKSLPNKKLIVKFNTLEIEVLISW